MSDIIKFKKLVKELEETEFYLSIHCDGKRIDGSFNFMYDDFLVKYAEWEVLDTNPLSEESDILIIEVSPPRVENLTPPSGKKIKEVTADGDDARKESPKHHPKVSARVRKK